MVASSRHYAFWTRLDGGGILPLMPSWEVVVAAAPELAAMTQERFASGKHSTLATLRTDGSPRISGSEVEFSDGEIWLGSMPGAVKALDLRRDPRFALHSPTSDPPSDNPAAWLGEAKIAGRAIEVSDTTASDQPHRFRLDITEVVFTGVADGQLEIVSWHPEAGVRTRHRR